jgi:hypothetical protein
MKNTHDAGWVAYSPAKAMLLLLLALNACAIGAFAQSANTGWPELTRENKPWTRWWWPGSAVDEASITRQLEQFAAAGLGGVEITPIYGAMGYEERYIDFLSPQWMAMLEHTGREALRLGLGVDMVTGTGWPFGGPWIDENSALSRLTLKDGRLTGEPTRMKVKRAAPGGQGLVVDPYSTAAFGRYVAPFSKVFAGFPKGLVRGQFHDSFEYYNASWTPMLPAVFREMHGYDIQQFAAELAAPKPEDVTTIDRDTLGRIKSDYRHALARLHLEFLRTWVAWSNENGFVVRNQSHGAPANLLDLYSAADIPETETFGSIPFPIPGLRRAADDIRSVESDPESLVSRMASSAAHFMGHPLVSSESATWLREHWKVSLAQVKPELDRLFAEGINHVFYHGTVFSPQDAPWPGWLFYASTQFNPNNTWWEDFGALNRYVGRVQSILQNGKPDNEILLYWPVADAWDGAGGLERMMGVNKNKWLMDQPVARTGRALRDHGYSFDFISDAQLQQVNVQGRDLVTPGARYKVLIVPVVRRMPVDTLQKIVEFCHNGVTVILEKVPEDVPGYGRLEWRRAEFRRALAQLGDRAIVNSDIVAALASTALKREPVAESGVSFMRRQAASGFDYFFANLTADKLEGWTTLGATFQSAAILDPLTGATGAAAVRTDDAGRGQIYLQLAPGESQIVRTRGDAAGTSRKWPNFEPAGKAVGLAGTWAITFIKGGPELPPSFETSELRSWTELGGEEARRFGGTARYRLEFEAPASKADDWLFDLGDVRESARVRLNGREAGTAWSVPLRLRVGEFLRPGRNVLELEVTNLAANRIRDMDQRKVPWKIMREINFVGTNYKPFDASGWALTPSGLLGPVTLTPLRALSL